MDEGSGATRNDSKGTNHLTVEGTVATAAGVRGTDVAASFAGTGDLIHANHSTLQVPSGGGSHCFFGWVYLNDVSNTAFIGGKWHGTGSADLEYAIEIVAGLTGLLGVNGGSAYYFPNPGFPVSISTWYFAVVWRDNADGLVRLQVNDGTIYVSSSASDPGANQPLYFGGLNNLSYRIDGREQMWGWIKGDFLSASERTTMYNAGSGKTWAEIVAEGL